MASRYRNLIKSSAEYTNICESIRGVELTGSGTLKGTSRLAYSKNMYKDYEGDGADVIESIPGYRCLAQLDGKIHSIFVQNTADSGGRLLIHAGAGLYSLDISDTYGMTASPKLIGSLSDSDSEGISYGSYFYILHGEKLARVSPIGKLESVSEDGAHPYIPTTYISGYKNEVRNLLTDKFIEEYKIEDPLPYTYSSDGLRFSIIDPLNRYCSLDGMDASSDEVIYIPGYISISGTEYLVSEIADRAFDGNTTVKRIQIASGPLRIGKFAFSKCTALKTIVLPRTVEKIDNGAFIDCSALENVYLGEGLREFGSSVFATCTSIAGIHYPLTSEEFANVVNKSVTDGKTMVYSSESRSLKIALPLHDKTAKINTVKLNGYNKAYMIKQKDGFISAVLMDFDSEAAATGISIRIEGELEPYIDSFTGADGSSGEGINGKEAVLGCTVAAVHDGRLFLSGNPKLPCTIFYSGIPSAAENSPLYIGMYNYLHDGPDQSTVSSMLSVGNTLMVFKGGVGSSGTIFCHEREETGEDRMSVTYPVRYIHSGLAAVGRSYSFLDDPVFLSEEGLSALTRENINYERSIECRSHNVNYSLLKEDLSRAYLATWQGYLVVGINGKMFLADSRSMFRHETGDTEYEWFLASDIGGYSNDSVVYRYASYAKSFTYVKTGHVGEIVTEPVYLYPYSDEPIYYSEETGTPYHVLPTTERTGGDFFPATVFASYKEKLFFGTEEGHLLVFNNDLRGTPPDEISSLSDFDAEEYSKYMRSKIHPYFYEFAGHTPSYEIRTSLDDCGIPHLTKSTVKKSLVIKAVSAEAMSIKCDVRTDRGSRHTVGYLPHSGGSFENFDFTSSMWYKSRYSSTALPEKEKAWIEKEITLSSEKVHCPISIWSMSYRYTIKGRIKNKE